MKDLIITSLEAMLGEASQEDVLALMGLIPAASTDDKIIDYVYAYIMSNGESIDDVPTIE